MKQQVTYVCQLTPPGAGAIAVIGLHGPDAARCLQPLLPPSFDLTTLLPHQLRVTQAGREFKERVVVSRSADDLLQVHCHGGVAVANWIIGELIEQGAVLSDHLTLLNRIARNPLHAEALLNVTQAATLRTAGILLDQVNRACESEVRDALDALDRGESERATAILDVLLGWRRLAKRLTTPWRVALAGAPNVGKSSLLNALVGYQRAIVAPSPGTTRDVVTACTAIDGWPVELCDTAGQRADASGVEAQGIDRARALCMDADLVLWLLDVTQPPLLPPDSLLAKTIPVLNKVDLPREWHNELGPHVEVSALTTSGVEDLMASIANRLVPQVPPPGAAVPPGAHAIAELEAAQRAMQESRASEATRLLAKLVTRQAE
jgi:tRNA modification GTPase